MRAETLEGKLYDSLLDVVGDLCASERIYGLRHTERAGQIARRIVLAGALKSPAIVGEPRQHDRTLITGHEGDLSAGHEPAAVDAQLVVYRDTAGRLVIWIDDWSFNLEPERVERAWQISNRHNNTEAP